MIAEDHAAFPFLSVARSDKKVVRDLNFRRAQSGRNVGQGRPVEDVSTFHADDLARLEFSDRKESAAVNRAVFDGRFR